MTNIKKIKVNDTTYDLAVDASKITGTLSADTLPSIPTTKLSGTISSANLPSYVDDVLEYSSFSALPTTGETGKIYVTTDNNRTYRWSGSIYVEISASLALGSTSSTAFRGDYGVAAYDHANAKGSAFSSGMYKITTNAQGHVIAASAVTKDDITALGIPDSDTNTHYTSKNVVGSSTAIENTTETLSNGNVYLNSIENEVVTSTHKISGAGATTVTSDNSGNIIITSTDHNTTYSAASQTDDGLMSATDKIKLNGVATGAQVNQNAFSNVKVGETTVTANSATDTITFAAGSNITITPDATNNKITIATTSDAEYDLGNFGITATAAELNKLDGVITTTTELNYVNGATSNIQTQLNAKVPTSRTVNGKALSDNISLSAVDVDAAATDIVTVSASAPTSTTCKIWIQP